MDVKGEKMPSAAPKPKETGPQAKTQQYDWKKELELNRTAAGWNHKEHHTWSSQRSPRPRAWVLPSHSLQCSKSHTAGAWKASLQGMIHIHNRAANNRPLLMQTKHGEGNTVAHPKPRQCCVSAVNHSLHSWDWGAERKGKAWWRKEQELTTAL